MNEREVAAEVLAVHEEYETALVSNDVATLDRLFWRSPDAVRFGAGEALYGYDQVAAFRKSRPPVDLARTVQNLKVVVIGPDAAVTTIEFDRAVAGVTRRGRQTQVWRRFQDGWQIVSAHVSFVWQPASYVDLASALVGVPIAPEHRPGVELNVHRARVIAQPLLDWDLPETVEMAAVFEP